MSEPKIPFLDAIRRGDLRTAMSIVSCLGIEDATPDLVESVFSACQAGWRHPDCEMADHEVKHPDIAHVVLRSGLHSGAYYNCPMVLRNAALCMFMAKAIVHEMQASGINPCDFQWVAGSATSAIGLSFAVATLLGKNWHPLQKDPSDPKGKTQLWQKCAIPSGEVVLNVEELTTTCGTPEAVQAAIRQANPAVEFFGYTPVLIYRPADLAAPNRAGDSIILPVLKIDVPNYERDNCPYCEAGSEAITDPKKDWAKLIGAA
ncbi:MAG: hypothetical protein JW816_02600 [Candidatus Buchananbacteria bacterium]|nr:hypothetical protein [Candidatus Buchananbacteria bacterium]